MYYDLIASLPHLPHFTLAQRLPITSLRLNQRLRRLKPAHAEQFERAVAVLSWRPKRLLEGNDKSLAHDYQALLSSPLDPALRAYAEFHIDQQTLLAALRRKRDGLDLPEGSQPWGAGSRVQHIRRRWDAPDFGLEYVHPWLPRARELLTAGDALGLEQLSMDQAWTWLTRCAERNMFGFQAVFSYVFRWDILRAWLACDAVQAKIRFTQLVDQVTHVDNN